MASWSGGMATSASHGPSRSIQRMWVQSKSTYILNYRSELTDVFSVVKNSYSWQVPRRLLQLPTLRTWERIPIQQIHYNQTVSFFMIFNKLSYIEYYYETNILFLENPNSLHNWVFPNDKSKFGSRIGKTKALLLLPTFSPETSIK